MSDELIISQCAPTLAGIKTANMFSAEYKSREEVARRLRALNATFLPRGLRIVPMRYMKNRVLLYLYRPAQLQRDLQNGLAAELLHQAGYAAGSCAQCVAELIRRFRRDSAFPHEVGLFLSYPPEDVKGFIDHRANGFKCAGLWKVYGDEEKARLLFAKYRKCTEIYCALWQSGSKLEQLAVAV